ncbi:hypothetical protein GALMADRAFT_139785 [Galerina marginata CBS 339.88]|uniref:Uncharacterized protein n=1 Tax=Galerina marginata (strain CBS 339.88) TaxID=685588 RepID=A0A067T153_GALM3|nr:hypothetical protein GALMADRAFT_139785 [Galerina marginata CBS 339.88]
MKGRGQRRRGIAIVSPFLATASSSIHGTGDPPAVTLLFLRLPPPPVAPVAYTHARPALFVTALFVVLASLAVHAVAWTLLAFVVVTTVPATVDECATRAAAGAWTPS